jgi:protoporphyrin/coproporphyrin ferrochelatase
MKQAVLIMAYGGPDSLDDIEPYLLDIRGGRPTSPGFVAEIRQRYAKIGGKSPLLEITNAQASALERCLNVLSPASDGTPVYRSYVGMRHWKPYIRETMARIAGDGYQAGVAFCMAPHASRLSTGVYLQKMREANALLPSALDMDFIECWHDQPFLIHALARKVQAAIEHFPIDSRSEIHYLFTAHSLPASIQEQGDPYTDQLQQTTRLLVQELGLSPGQWSFGFQSAGAAPGQWLGPSVEEILPEFASRGMKNVLVTPIGFMADHVEILFDLDIEAQEIAEKIGMRLIRSESLNVSPDFIEGLAKFILEKTTTGKNGFKS